jgi:hypothetical protein
MSAKDKIESELKKNLFLLRNDFPRDLDKTVRGRAAFLSEAQQLRASTSRADKQKSLGRKQGDRSKFPVGQYARPRLFGALTPVLLALIFILGTGWATVHASQNSQPSQLLYSVKLASEDVALKIAADPSAQFNLSVDYVQNRASEIILIFNEGKAPSEEVIGRFASQVERSVEIAAGLPDNNAVDALNRLQNRLETQEQAITYLKVVQSADADAAKVKILGILKEQITNCKVGQTDLVRLRELIRQRQLSNDVLVTSTSIQPTATPHAPQISGPTATPGNGNSQATHTRTPGIGNGQGSESEKTKTHTPPAYGQGGKDSITSTPSPTTMSGAATATKTNSGKHKGKTK